MGWLQKGLSIAGGALGGALGGMVGGPDGAVVGRQLGSWAGDKAGEWSEDKLSSEIAGGESERQATPPSPPPAGATEITMRTLQESHTVMAFTHFDVGASGKPIKVYKIMTVWELTRRHEAAVAALALAAIEQAKAADAKKAGGGLALPVGAAAAAWLLLK